MKIPRSLAIAAGVTVLVFIVGGWNIIDWTMNYHWVPVGSSMQLRYKGPPLPIPGLGTRDPADEGQFAKVETGDRFPAQLGVLQEMVGPGRHFYSPFWWECKIVPDIVIEPGAVGVVESLMGKKSAQGDYIVDGNLGDTEYSGILRKVLPPGQYRINPYAYKITIVKTDEIRNGSQLKLSGWVSIPTGYVGVVTNLTANLLEKRARGIQNDVLPPGLYMVNGREQQVDVIFVGYREYTVETKVRLDASGLPMFEPSGEPIRNDDESGIGFTSQDGFNIRMDFVSVWGIMPDQAADVIRNFGTVDALEKNVVDPQIQNICRSQGQMLGAEELLVGTSRETFQIETQRRFKEALEEKGVSVLTGLVRNIFIPQQVRTPIQQTNIATELQLTREQEQVTAHTEGELREAEQKVKLATDQTTAETEKLVAEELAKGEKQAAELKAGTQKLVATIAKDTAQMEAEATRTLGEATAKSRQLQEEAKAQKFVLAVEAFGNGDAYNRWVFAEGLPADIQIDMLYAGPGTFWTDLKGFSETMLGKQVSEQGKSPAAAGTARPGVTTQPRPVQPPVRR